MAERLGSRSTHIGSTAIGVKFLKTFDKWFSEHHLPGKVPRNLIPNSWHVRLNGNSSSKSRGVKVLMETGDVWESSLCGTRIVKEAFAAKGCARLKKLVSSKTSTCIGAFRACTFLLRSNWFDQRICYLRDRGSHRFRDSELQTYKLHAHVKSIIGTTKGSSTNTTAPATAARNNTHTRQSHLLPISEANDKGEK